MSILAPRASFIVYSIGQSQFPLHPVTLIMFDTFTEEYTQNKYTHK